MLQSKDITLRKAPRHQQRVKANEAEDRFTWRLVRSHARLDLSALDEYVRIDIQRARFRPSLADVRDPSGRGQSAKALVLRWSALLLTMESMPRELIGHRRGFYVAAVSGSPVSQLEGSVQIMEIDCVLQIYIALQITPATLPWLSLEWIRS